MRLFGFFKSPCKTSCYVINEYYNLTKARLWAQVMDSDFRDMARDKELRASMGFRNTFEVIGLLSIAHNRRLRTWWQPLASGLLPPAECWAEN